MEKMDGKALSLEMRETLAARVQKFKETFDSSPCLAVVLVGGDPASQVYVRNKIKACQAVGIKSVEYKKPADISQDDLIQLVQDLNEDSEVNGILVQLPLPNHINEAKVLEHLSPMKDADGLCVENLGLLASGKKRIAPCTPHGVIQLLKKHKVSISGKKAVVVGRSNIVGKPMALLLLEENATVTICHSKTENLREHLHQADIVVVAAGRPEFLGQDDFSEGTVIVDVGIHRKADGKLCGDVRYGELTDVAWAMTPVPGGVGPMTIAMLLENTVQLSELQREKGQLSYER